MLPLNQYQRLDVRPILASGGEPLTLIRERIASLPPGEGLLVIAPFLPSPLIEMLRGEGFQSKTIRDPRAGWQVYFWK
jgi:uncharacterized protein (DUF2249 family)